MTDKLDLTAFERVQLVSWLGRQQGDVGYIRCAIALIDRLELSDEEKELAGWRQDGDVIQFKNSEVTFELELGKSELLLLKLALQQKWPINRLILAMLEKLEAACS